MLAFYTRLTPVNSNLYQKPSQSNQDLFIDTKYHYILVMFDVGLLVGNGIVVDMLEVHDLLVDDLNLAKISLIPRFYERNRMCLGQDQEARQLYDI